VDFFLLEFDGRGKIYRLADSVGSIPHDGSTWVCPDLLKVKIRIASQYSLTHPATQALNKFKEQVESASEGKISIQVCPNSELGDYTNVHEGLSQGTIGMALISVPSQLDHRLEATYLPYLATEYSEAKAIYARGSALFEEVDQVHSELGIKFLGFNMQGFGGLGLKSKPQKLAVPGEEKHICIRVPPMKVFKLAAKDQGFDAVTVPFNEVENVLETDAIDGVAGCPPLAIFHHFQHSIKYYLVTRGFVETTSYLMSESLWSSLTPEQQQLFQETIDQLSGESFEKAEQQEKDYFKRLGDAGIEVSFLSPQELDARARHTRTITWPKLYPYLNPNLVESLQALAEQDTAGIDQLGRKKS
jgi:TRAP-type transport system periplasmic protein